MDSIAEMLRTSPQDAMASESELVECISECLACAQACTGVADACLGEEHIHDLRRCIRLNLDCADVCVSTGQLLSRQLQPDPDIIRRQVELLAFTCRKCADESARHAEMLAHCRVGEEACRRCAEACERLLGALIRQPAAEETEGVPAY